MKVFADSFVMKYSLFHELTNIFDITDIRGDWAVKDSGWAIAKYANDCCNLRSWDWHHPNATGWAKMTLRVDARDPGLAGIGNAECVARAIVKAGGPADASCFQES